MTLYHKDKSTEIHNGDCLEVLRTLPDCSVDACVTDPPYGLAFMGKRWDYDVPAVEVWQEVLRVLKPGGHLLAFAGTRTQHRMAVRIEDAGFEIRDMIAWVYGSGFPKSLDVSKAIDKAAGAEREVVGSRVADDIRSGNMHAANRGERHVINITAPATEAAKQWAGWGTALKPSWESVTWARKPLPLETERRTIRTNLFQMEARLWLLLNVSVVKSSSASNQSEFAEALNTARWTADECISTQAGLCDQMGMSLFELAANISLNTVSSWNRILGDVWNQTSTSTIETASSMTTDWKTLRYCLSQITVENMLQANSLPGGFNANACNAGRTFSALLASLEATLTLSAIGPAMSQAAESYPEKDVRPHLEPVMVARKPLSGTVAANVLEHGTGAINVDGCRVGTDDVWAPSTRGASESIGTFKTKQRTTEQHDAGRWPANLIHDGSDEVVGLFPETVSGSGIKGKRSKVTCYGEPTQDLTTEWDGDSGSASRFFYCAKADPSERRNSKHPTIKPVALMRYLVRLVCPAGGVVLDPFAGSGTTIEAARLEHCRAIGIEREAEYCADILERLRQGVLF
jgi:DNA modification methylase